VLNAVPDLAVPAHHDQLHRREGVGRRSVALGNRGAGRSSQEPLVRL
jgi:hypothetical protein